MSLQYELVRAVLTIEIALFLLLEVPISRPQKERIIGKIRASVHLQSFLNVARVILAFVSLLFVDALVRSVKFSGQWAAQKEIAHSVKGNAYHALGNLHAKMFYAQRNLYLTGFTLALAFVLAQHFKAVLANMDLEARLKHAEDQGPERRRTNKAILEELEKLREKSKTAEAALSQAKAQQEEYHRLADRYNELEAKLNPEDRKTK